VAEDGVGTTRGSLEGSCDIENPPNNCCALSWDAVPGAVRYRIYKKGDLPGEQYDKYHTSLTNSYDYKTDSGAASAPEGVPEVTTAYANKFSADSPSWILNGNVGIGTANPESTLDVKGPISGFGIVPIGSIIAWHKSFPNTPAIPDGWVECNGQTLIDPASAYHGQAIPKLNADTGTGDGGMFLRGNSTSGIVQSDQMQDHKHDDMGHSHVVNNVVDGTLVIINFGAPGGPTEPNNPTNRTTTTAYANLTGPRANNTLNIPRVGLETRPVNFSVVWIMRVK